MLELLRFKNKPGFYFVDHCSIMKTMSNKKKIYLLHIHINIIKYLNCIRGYLV